MTDVHARAPRGLIRASWQRVARNGVDSSGHPEISPVAEVEVMRRREVSPLAQFLPLLRQWISPATMGTGQALIVADSEGHVLWREGSRGVKSFADQLGFVEGSFWVEGNVGTNAIGTALVLQEPVGIHGDEHFVEAHRDWTCAAAPVIDPISRQSIGVIDLSGPTSTRHPQTLALVNLAAHAISQELRTQYEAGLECLRATSAPILTRLSTPALVVSTQGITAAAVGLVPPERVLLPHDMAPGLVHIPHLGHVRAEPLPGGWLLQCDDEAPETQVTLDLTSDTPVVNVLSTSGQWSHRLSPRHAQIVRALIRFPHGRSASELADLLFCDPTRTVTIRAELSRLRRILGTLLKSQPYRFSDDITLRVTDS